MQLVLSLFSGVGLLDQAFRENGFCVVSAGDLITGQDVRDFTGMKNKFSGVIGGSPCQDFSGLKRVKTDYSNKMIIEFLRVVSECEPDWYLLENVKGVPNLTDLNKNSVTPLREYSHQRIDINQGWYDDYSRLRHIQFGSKQNFYLDIPRGTMKNIISGCALASDDRSFKELCHIQGLPSDYDLKDFNVKGKKKAVGNGVPLSVGRVLAKAVLDVTDPGNKGVNYREEKSVTLKSSQGKISFTTFLNDRNISFDSRMSSGFICSVCNTQFNHTAHNRFDSKVHIFSLFEYLDFDYMDFLNNKDTELKVKNFCNSIGVKNTTFFLSICDDCFQNHSLITPAVESVTLLHKESVTQQDKKRCACGCGRELIGKKKCYDSTCRKRLSRKSIKCDLAAEQKK
ncbi:DNA cytosine methyltransferase [Sulfurimonas sp.]|uniref:DNA cytosine methyltransferase n=1 Tax=Sulfurimonas sp. TaxID=2022749 RepID=UPI002B45E49E|nr:DNA cytosine methyltransferase [Sulfurimonas sp.]